MRHPRTIHQDVQRRQPGKCRIHLPLIRNIRRNSRGLTPGSFYFLYHGRRLRFVDIHDRYMSALPRQYQGHGLTDAAPGPGHYCIFIR
jgi:hypothetical protein